jgi:tetratricopeptide (TPR) repeat protein
MAKAAIDFDSETSNLLNEAQTLLSGCNDKIILSYLEFFTGLFLHHAASQVPSRLRTITKISITGLSLNEGLSWNAMCQSALTLLEQVKNECWFDPLEGVEDSDEVKHLPLSGHICFKKGQIYELIDMMDQALNSYVDAANFYRIACGDENMYVASVLHRMGMICSQRTEYHALGYFNEALTIRKNLLGGNDRLVADTLFASAEIFARLNRYEASMERYHEALRIQMADSQDSNEVARTLAGMGTCHYNHKAYDLALTCFEGAVKIRKYRVSRLTEAADLVELYGEEVNLGQDFFNSGNVHMQTGNYAQAMQCFIQSRDLRWRHVGSGTVEKILHKYATEVTVDEDELLGLAHCLHNIGVMFDIKGDYERSLPHYEEALAIKNAIAGFDDSTLLVEQVNPEENRALVLRSLHKDQEFPRINKATLSASMTRQRIATVYLKQRKYDLALFEFSHALAIQRNVLGKDNFRIGLILTSMGKALRRTAKHSDTAIMCYNESLRISKLRFGQNHASVASALFDIGSLHACNENFGKAKDYYQSALDVYKQKYSQELRQRMCSGLDRPRGLSGSEGASTEFLSNGDEIIVAGDASRPEKEIREQYARVTEALRKVKRLDMLNRGEHISCVGDSDDAWLTFEVLLFRFVEMLSTYIVDPAQTAMRNTIDGSRRRIESAAAHAVINAADALDYQFLLLLQE